MGLSVILPYQNINHQAHVDAYTLYWMIDVIHSLFLGSGCWGGVGLNCGAYADQLGGAHADAGLGYLLPCLWVRCTRTRFHSR